jgi:hypothetical protein
MGSTVGMILRSRVPRARRYAPAGMPGERK